MHLMQYNMHINDLSCAINAKLCVCVCVCARARARSSGRLRYARARRSRSFPLPCARFPGPTPNECVCMCVRERVCERRSTLLLQEARRDGRSTDARVGYGTSHGYSKVARWRLSLTERIYTHEDRYAK